MINFYLQGDPKVEELAVSPKKAETKIYHHTISSVFSDMEEDLHMIFRANLIFVCPK